MNNDAELSDLSHVIELMRDLHSESRSGATVNSFTHGIEPDSFPFCLWFRGEGDHAMPLIPGIFRKRNGKAMPIKEPSVCNHMQARLPALYEIENPFDRLCVAQHHGIPTRLLDWSESVLVATFFCVTSGGTSWKDKDGYLYVLNPYTLNQIAGLGDGKSKIHVSTDYGTLFRAEIAYSFSRKDWAQRTKKNYPEFNWEKHSKVLPCSIDEIPTGKHLSVFKDPMAVFPPRLDQRMIVQSAAFTLHGGGHHLDPEDAPSQFPQTHTELGNTRKVYMRYKIAAANKEKIKNQLFWVGLHKGVLFPEMDHQAEFLETVV